MYPQRCSGKGWSGAGTFPSQIRSLQITAISRSSSSCAQWIKNLSKFARLISGLYSWRQEERNDEERERERGSFHFMYSIFNSGVSRFKFNDVR
jgi:hypothetical protein